MLVAAVVPASVHVVFAQNVAVEGRGQGRKSLEITKNTPQWSDVTCIAVRKRMKELLRKTRGCHIGFAKPNLDSDG
jgi:hypothetical protein